MMQKLFLENFLTKISSFLMFHIIPITERYKNNFSMIFLLFFLCAFRASSEVIRGVEAAVAHELKAMLTQIKFEDEL